jgi:hypothetical protein
LAGAGRENLALASGSSWSEDRGADTVEIISAIVALDLPALKIV